jgi:hypothetical protein
VQQDEVLVRKAASWKAHEDWSDDFVDEHDPKNTFDIALMQFTGQTPETHKPALLVNEDVSIENGSRLLVAGYGFLNESFEPGEDGWPQMPSGDGVLRSAEVTVLDKDFSRTEVLTSEQQAGTTSADSGGPAFIKNEEGRLILWGVTSRGLTGQDGVYTRVGIFLSWISEQIGK